MKSVAVYVQDIPNSINFSRCALLLFPFFGADRFDAGPASDRYRRRNPVIAVRSGEGPFSIPFADLAHRVLPTGGLGFTTYALTSRLRAGGWRRG